MNKKLLMTLMIAGAASVFAMTGCGDKNAAGGSTQVSELASSYVDDVSKYITLGDYKGLTYKTADVTVTDDEINGELDYLIEQYATVEQITDRAVADGDTVSCHFLGRIDGEAFDGGTGDIDDLVIGSHSFIDDFEEQMIGMKAGETRNVEVTFPEDYGNADLASKDAVFEVTLNYIAGEQIIPELTDEFIAENTEYKTIDEYRDYVKGYIEDYKASSAESERSQKLWQQAIDNATVISLPEDKVEEEKQKVYDMYEQYAQMYGVEFDEILNMMGTNAEDFETEAVSNAQEVVKRKLLFYAIVAAENIGLTDEEYQKQAEELVNEYGYESVEKLEEDYGADTLKEELVWRQVLDVILSNAVEE